ncbi:hypothetical protein B0H15DRAFT_829198 [Mycena belliarum]|uniref:Uncharacterized protein n=1 Tax=Mycena belliarum TaxID=1033014 RepID=A0AAD6XS25_9AGAR|nr:hypothetical protein B0H15DRAFT_829198 [Mycena belliae]
MYVYVEDTEQKRIVQARKDRKGLALGQGGEGYIADDEWCYNCGGAGHWGDVSSIYKSVDSAHADTWPKDCREFYHPDALVEPTAFSFRVLSAGPFAPPQNASGSRAPRDWERDVSLPGGVEHVGRRAKKKEMEKLTRRAQLQEADDSDNWFQNRNVKNRRESEREHDRPAGKVPTGPKMAIGPSSKEAPRPFQFAPVGPSSSKVSLSDRLSDPKEGRRDGKSHAQRRVERDRALDSNTRHRSDRERNNIGHRDERGPRYRGGYAR